MFKLEIATDNAAFHEDEGGFAHPFYWDNGGAAEIARILRETADRVAAGQYTNKLRDANGKTVGSVYWEAANE